MSTPKKQGWVRDIYEFMRIFQKTHAWLDKREEKRLAKIESRRKPSGSFFRDTFDPFPARDARELKERYIKLKALHEEHFGSLSLGDLAAPIALQAFEERPRNAHMFDQFFFFVVGLLEYDGLFEFPEVDVSKLNAEEMVELRRVLNRFEYFFKDFWKSYLDFSELLTNNLACVLDYIPDSPNLDDRPNDFLIPMLDVMQNPVEVLDRLVVTILTRKDEDAKLFHPKWKSIMERNAARINDREFTLPSETKKDIHDLIELYLSGIPYREIFYLTFPFSFQPDWRFEHLVGIAGSGWGKTMLLKHLLSKDQHGIIVMDSQGVLIRKLARIKWNREVILVDPEDVDWPLGFSLFGVDISQGTKAEREAILNSAVATYEYLFSGLLGAGLTSRQGAMFGYVARLMMEIPNATIYTLKDIFADGRKYQEYINKLDGTEREYFDTQFFEKKLHPVKEQILDRLYGAMRNPTFRRIFAQTENKLDLHQAMQDGKIILINTAKSFLSGDLYQTFGKFWIAMISLATNKRQFSDKHTPVMIYIDEIREYMRDPRYLEDLITQARKYHVGLNMFFQDTSQMGGLKQTIMGSVRIKFAGGVGAADRNFLSKELDCTEDDLRDLKKVDFKGSEWMVGVRNEIHFKTWINYGALSDREKYTDEEYQSFIDEFHQKYCNRDEEPQPELQPQAKDEAKITVEEEHENANAKPEQKPSPRPHLPPAEVDYWKDL